MHILTSNDTTGAREIREVDFELPIYGLGYWVCIEKEGAIVKEGVVTGVQMTMWSDKHTGRDVQSYTYELDNGVDFLTEDEITHYEEAP